MGTLHDVRSRMPSQLPAATVRSAPSNFTDKCGTRQRLIEEQAVALCHGRVFFECAVNKVLQKALRKYTSRLGFESVSLSLTQRRVFAQLVVCDDSMLYFQKLFPKCRDFGISPCSCRIRVDQVHALAKVQKVKSPRMPSGR
tara:strand:- start:112 stop:537 length:426 start_codon:yes stop_codon:yes gene_type:complete